MLRCSPESLPNGNCGNTGHPGRPIWLVDPQQNQPDRLAGAAGRSRRLERMELAKQEALWMEHGGRETERKLTWRTQEGMDSERGTLL